MQCGNTGSGIYCSLNFSYIQESHDLLSLTCNAFNTSHVIKLHEKYLKTHYNFMFSCCESLKIIVIVIIVIVNIN